MLTTHGPDDECTPADDHAGPSKFDGDLGSVLHRSEVAAEAGRNPAVLVSYSDPDGSMSPPWRADVQQDRAKVNDLWKPFTSMVPRRPGRSQDRPHSVQVTKRIWNQRLLRAGVQLHQGSSDR